MYLALLKDIPLEIFNPLYEMPRLENREGHPLLIRTGDLPHIVNHLLDERNNSAACFTGNRSSIDYI